MKKQTTFILVVFLLFVLSCRNNSAKVEQEDKETTLLIGTWTSNDNTCIEFQKKEVIRIYRNEKYNNTVLVGNYFYNKELRYLAYKFDKDEPYFYTPIVIKDNNHIFILDEFRGYCSEGSFNRVKSK